MQFHSLYFVFFISIIFVIYYIVPKKFQWYILLLGSVLFYLFSGFINIFYVLFTTITTFLITKKIDRIYNLENDNNKAKKKTKKLLLLSLILNLGILCFVKYFNFFSISFANIIQIFDNEYDAVYINILVPLGISFYTFMNVGYMLDVYWKKYSAEKNIFKFACFTLYFPHIVQGPISRYNKLSLQLFEKHKFNINRLRDGIILISWGFFKKLVIADRLNILVSKVFNNWELYNGTVYIVAIICYSIQIYTDFSGYMDIARGTSKIFGIDLDQNFLRPYFAKTIPEFWRRWHITLYQWFKDYLLFPVSISKFAKTISKFFKKKWGKRAGRISVMAISLVVVWFITGLWHGAAWKFIAWGLFHGTLIFLGILFEPLLDKASKNLKINKKSLSWRLYQMLRTFALCTLGRVFFLATGVISAFRIFKGIFFNFNINTLTDGTLMKLGLNLQNIIVVSISILILWVVSLIQERGSLTLWYNNRNIIIRWGILYFMIIFIILFGLYGSRYEASLFIYNQF